MKTRAKIILEAVISRVHLRHLKEPSLEFKSGCIWYQQKKVSQIYTPPLK